MQAAINVLIDLVKRKESGELRTLVIAIFGVVNCRNIFTYMYLRRVFCCYVCCVNAVELEHIFSHT